MVLFGGSLVCFVRRIGFGVTVNCCYFALVVLTVGCSFVFVILVLELRLMIDLLFVVLVVSAMILFFLFFRLIGVMFVLLLVCGCGFLSCVVLFVVSLWCGLPGFALAVVLFWADCVCMFVAKGGGCCLVAGGVVDSCEVRVFRVALSAVLGWRLV